MRFFVAIDLSKEVKNYLFDLQKKIKSSNYAKVNWVFKRNLHCTLKYFGEVSNVYEIKEKLKNVRFESFKLNLKDVGIFPSKRLIRIVWVGLEPKRQLLELANKVDAETISKENYEFVSHITLGRVKIVKKKEEFISLLKNLKVDGLEVDVKEFVLMKSELRREGANYSVVERYLCD